LESATIDRSQLHAFRERTNVLSPGDEGYLPLTTNEIIQLWSYPRIPDALHRSLATLRKYIREGSLFLENAAAKVGL